MVTESGLSKLQKSVLRHGLMAHYRKETDLGCGKDYPGCFRARSVGIADKDWDDRRIRANKRAAAGHAIGRLISRGLVEPVARGWWRLSALGEGVAVQLWPEIKKPTPEQKDADVQRYLGMAEFAERCRFERWRERQLERRIKKAREAVGQLKPKSKTWIVKENGPGVIVNFDFSEQAQGGQMPISQEEFSAEVFKTDHQI